MSGTIPIKMKLFFNSHVIKWLNQVCGIVGVGVCLLYLHADLEDFLNGLAEAYKVIIDQA